MSSTIIQSFAKGDTSVCYLRFTMAPEIVPIPCGKTKEEMVSAMEISNNAIDERPGQIMIPINQSDQSLIIFSRTGGITLGLGIDDYTSFTEPYCEPDHRIHEFYRNGSKYFTIIKTSIVQQLSGVAKQIWEANKKGPLLKIMLYIDSTENGQSEISNKPTADPSGYFDVTDLGNTLTGVILKPEIKRPVYNTQVADWKV
jgi:hypothetical protein